jgi:hypothetical protein
MLSLRTTILTPAEQSLNVIQDVKWLTVTMVQNILGVQTKEMDYRERQQMQTQ